MTINLPQVCWQLATDVSPTSCCKPRQQTCAFFWQTCIQIATGPSIGKLSKSRLIVLIQQHCYNPMLSTLQQSCYNRSALVVSLSCEACYKLSKIGSKLVGRKKQAVQTLVSCNLFEGLMTDVWQVMEFFTRIFHTSSWSDRQQKAWNQLPNRKPFWCCKSLLSFVFHCESCWNLVTVFNKENCKSAKNLKTK